MEVWREILLASIGEQFATVLEAGDEINGLSLSTRYVFLFALLTSGNRKTSFKFGTEWQVA
jgi:hypothetical protein